MRGTAESEVKSFLLPTSLAGVTRGRLMSPLCTQSHTRSVLSPKLACMHGFIVAAHAV